MFCYPGYSAVLASLLGSSQKQKQRESGEEVRDNVTLSLCDLPLCLVQERPDHGEKIHTHIRAAPVHMSV